MSEILEKPLEKIPMMIYMPKNLHDTIRIRSKHLGESQNTIVRGILSKELLNNKISRTLKSGNWYDMYRFITSKKTLVDKGGFWRPTQIYSISGNGKSFTTMKMIEEVSRHGWNNLEFCVIDPKSEYDNLEDRKSIGGEGTYRFVPQSFGINLMEEMGAMQIYNQICNEYKEEYKTKGDTNRVIIIDEAHRFANAEMILREVRHNFRCVFVTNKLLAEGFPTIYIEE